MSFELFTGFVAFAFVSSITPGPNNLMLLASGANFGLRRSLPHMMGIGVGFMFLIIMVGAGLMQVFEAVPLSYTVLRIASVAFLVWLAWKIATAAPPSQVPNAAGKPLSFLQAAAFQWVNPKAWAMSLTAVSVYAPGDTFLAVLLVAGVFAAVNLPSITCWTVLGTQIRRLLDHPAKLRAFNLVAATLLLASLYPILKTL